MANKHETLTSLFSAIADAIRSKTGETGTLIADNFPSLIEELGGGVSGESLDTLGLSGIACGTFTVADASTKLSEVEMVHNLGVVPKLVSVFVVSGDEPSSPTMYFREGVKYPSITTMCCINWNTPSSTSSEYNTGCSSTETTCHISDPIITGGKYYAPDCTYGWIIVG